MFGDSRIDEVKDRLRSVGCPRVAGRGGYRDDRALRVPCRNSLEDPDNVVDDHRASHFCQLLKQRERGAATCPHRRMAAGEESRRAQGSCFIQKP